ncbi:DUF3320 domain-containing protein [Proteiniclasticum sp. BAD-10]|uniref:DUF3320 domain-containing protein n=1 Tax=Proteiniclasticum sediminis TaxID=2804028 RepID=A0A941CP87_9CLOT|nr:DUF3320 domain-containing protein [Proteiniclasticum sediminis]MBR0575303.1 DUF3320 domain-containing protein [Proteiniclasticum sediminis]
MEEKKLLTVTLNYLKTLNYAMAENGIPFLRNATVENLGEEELRNLRAVLRFQEDFCPSLTLDLPVLPPKMVVDLGQLDVRPRGEHLFSLTENMTLDITVEIWKGEELLQTERYPVLVLAYNGWPGYEVMPELLAAFVTPNHPAIDKLIVEASEILQASGKDPSFEGYQSRDINRVREQVLALYTAIQNRFLTYVGPPASFLESGQRIRLADEVLEKALGTCLDWTLLFASCLEAISLHPLVILVQGHAFLGFWQEEQFFADAVETDLAALTKRTAAGVELIGLLETTDVRTGLSVSFGEAQAHGAAHLLAEKEFLLAVDIHRARVGGIRPLPQRLEQGGVFVEAPQRNREERILTLPALEQAVRLPEAIPGEKSGKKTQWERKLLDLSLRNNLLNHTPGKKGVELLVPSAKELEDLLDEGKEFQLLPAIPEAKEQPGVRGALDAQETLQQFAPLLAGEFTQQKLRTTLTEEELSRRLTKLSREAKLSLEESGANSLFLALGLLKWYETPRSEKPRYAPILMVPVELVKKVGRSIYMVRGRDEETLINVTLLEKLKQEYSITVQGLDPVPLDDQGVDVLQVFSIMRQAVLGQKRWDVLDAVNLGIFSFSKFILWNDLKNHGDDLAKHPVISSLLEGKLTFEAQALDPEDRLLDETIDPAEILLPVSTDASQLQAVEAAVKGKSFVLHGPPGTGKSQTITTIIANALYQGKRVLFVAEKMAALSVVQRRLENLGLGHFSLEVHSNKSKKTAILKKLEETIHVTRENGIPFAEEARKVREIRTGLNAQVAALYKTYSFGHSAYSLIGLLESLKDQEAGTLFRELSLDTLSSEGWEELQLLGRELASITRETGEYADAPLKGMNLAQYSYTLKGEMEEALKQLKPLADALATSLEQMEEQKLPVLETQKTLEALGKLVKISAARPNAELMQSLSPELLDVLTQALNLEAQRKGLETGLLESYRPQVLNLNPPTLRQELQTAETKLPVLKTLARRKVLHPLSALSLQGPLDTSKALALFDALLKLQNLKEGVEALLQTQPLLSPDNLQEGTALLRDLQETLEVKTLLGFTGEEPFWTLLQDKAQITGFLQAYDRFFAVYPTFSDQFAWSLGDLPELEGNWPRRLSDRLETYGKNLEALREWTNYNALKAKCSDKKVEELITDFEAGKFLGEEAELRVKKTLALQAFQVILQQEPLLSHVTGRQVEDQITYFKEVHRRYEELAMKEIRSTLASKVPDLQKEASSSSEVGILQRAIRSGGRGTTLRALFDRLPNLLPRITPCMLMSPLSVAQYLRTDRALFDLVIFDEASQMPTAESVGAMARGKEVVIVGDPKQLPPTTFFSTQNGGEEEILEDLDNILEDALALSLPETSLLWHYRSRHESLIAFSNRAYYENKLYTYPSPRELASQVSLTFVEATYGRGGTRSNPVEAKAVVEEIMGRLTDPRREKDSLGVVTFSMAQKDLIEDLLQEALKDRPDMEEKILTMEEPVFVKNLENVQGDERDVILFSTGYGPDADGKLSLNFGPLNRENGWKRLNVAITRSKKEMKIFTSIRPEMIDTAKTSAQGVHDLKRFLEFAQRGTQAVALEDVAINGKETLSHAIARELEAKGLKVVTGIGASRYKVDLGIVDENDPSRFSLGILCQGDSYKDARSARDRNILQESMLSGLGWSLIHVYPMDWVENKAREVDRILAKLSAKEGEGASSSGASVPVFASYPGTVAPAEVLPSDTAGSRYLEVQLQVPSLSAEEFRMPKNTRLIKDALMAVIEGEAPISASLLTRKILKAFGVRWGEKSRQVVDGFLSELGYPIRESYGQLFVYRGEEEVSFYRTPTPECRRDPEDLPPEEILLAAEDVIRRQVSLPEESLWEEVGKLFGYSRRQEDMVSKVKAVLQDQVPPGCRREDSGNYISE